MKMITKIEINWIPEINEYKFVLYVNDIYLCTFWSTKYEINGNYLTIYHKGHGSYILYSEFDKIVIND